MGDPKRFDKFSSLIAERINKNAKIADVAGGKGLLRIALAEKGIKDVETWDKRQVHRSGKQRFAYFDYQTAPEYDSIVAMHSDEGTDHSILYAAKHGVSAFVCPCCAKGSAVAYWGANKYNEWIKHLLNLADKNGLKWYHEKMKFNGRNDFFHFSPK
jgi:hypothetical protein